jgi:hypothetical protein
VPVTRRRPLARLGVVAAAALSFALVVQPAGPAQAAVDTMTVDFARNGGAPTYRASGFIYGTSTSASAPPVATTDQIKVKLMRAGGSQIGCPNGGWVNGQYGARWSFMRSYYGRAQRTGATTEMLLSGLWGSDGVCNVPRWPGDNGDWTEYTQFVAQVVNDARAAGMTGSNVRWDLWNEPNIFFWGRSQAQYLEMIRRGTQQVRAAFPNAVVEGPSYAGPPSNNAWWNTYLDFVKANNVVPDVISWHDLPGDPVPDRNTLNAMLSAKGIGGVRGVSVNEYGAFGAEQQPGPSAWYIARLERCNCDGARANWGMVGQTPSLYDTLGWLTTPNAGQPMGQWWVYKRYADQTGSRTHIDPGSSHDGIVFQDSGARRSIAVYGARAGGATGAIDVRYTNVPSWLQSGGSVNVRVERMPSTNAYVAAPTVVSNSRVTVSGGSILTTINWTNADDAYAVTLTP